MNNKQSKFAAKRMVPLLLAMIKTGVLGYGGGPSVLPLVRHEVVTRYKWMKDEEFGELIAIANTLPGPILTKVAAYLGYRMAGAIGAFLAIVAHILPTTIAIVAMMSVVQLFSTSNIVSGMIAAVIPVICVMLGMMAYEFAERAVKGLGIYLGIGTFALSFALLELVQLHPAIVIILFLAYGTIHFKVVNRFSKRKGSS